MESNDSMKVMHIGDFDGYGRAIRSNPEVELTYLDPFSSPKTEAECRDAGQAYFSFSTKRKVDLTAVRSLRRIIKKQQPDLIHAFYPRALATAVLATMGLRNSPILISFRGIITLLSRWNPENYITYFHPRVFWHTCESEAERQSLIESGLPMDSCVKLERTFPPVDGQGLGREDLLEYGIPSDAFVVGTISTIRPVKGIDLLLEAAKQCVDLKDLFLLFIGPIEDSKVRKMVEDPRIRDRVKMVGFQKSPAKFMASADLYAMPSRMEGLGRALLEAMSYGICPLVSDAGGMKEIVRDGQDGVVVPKEDVAALAEAIRSLHADREKIKKYGESAKQRMNEHLSPDKIEKKLLAFYKKVLA
jgi:L-malate glycosyltransferase